MRLGRNSKRDTREDLKLAELSLQRAVAAKEEQEGKRAREEPLINRLERIAVGNHLASKFLEAFTERHA